MHLGLSLFLPSFHLRHNIHFAAIDPTFREEMAPILLMGPSKGDPIQATSRHHIQVRARMPSLIPLSLTPQIEGAHTPSNLPLPPHPPEEQQHHNLNLVLQINRDFLMKRFELLILLNIMICLAFLLLIYNSKLLSKTFVVI